jgi:hypothetical protein
MSSCIALVNALLTAALGHGLSECYPTQKLQGSLSLSPALLLFTACISELKGPGNIVPEETIKLILFKESFESFPI